MARNRIPAPFLRAGACIESTNSSALEIDAAIVAHRRADDHDSANNRRRRSHAVLALLDRPDILREIDHPIRAKVSAQLSLLGVDGDQSCVDRWKENSAGAWSISTSGRVDP